MNFVVEFIGLKKEPYDTCLKLFIQSAQESDYRTETVAWHRKTPFSPAETTIRLIGSTKKEFLTILVDFDNITHAHAIETVVSPATLGLDYSSSGIHYWGALGALLKIIPDISTAYVNGYLIEQKMNDALTSFKQFGSTLPATMQLQLQSTMRDV